VLKWRFYEKGGYNNTGNRRFSTFRYKGFPLQKVDKMSNEKFMFYENFLDALDMLPEGEREKACYEFCKYGITGELPKDRSLAMFCIGVSASVRKYDGRGGAREGAGRKSKNSEISEKQTDNIDCDNSENSKESKNSKKSEFSENSYSTNINLNINKNINFKHKQDSIIQPQNDFEENQANNKTKFRKPNVDEVKSYCHESGYKIDAERFVDFYECKGWKVGKNPMKDWKAAVRNWARTDNSDNDNQKTEIYETPEKQAERQLMLEAIQKTEELQKKRIEEKYGSFD
jgi:hypothetical protein